MSSAPNALQEQFLLPPPALREVVQHLVLLTVAEGAAPIERTLLPSFQVVLLLNLGEGRAELWPAGDTSCAAMQPLEKAGVTSPVKTAWRYRLAGGAQVLAVNFTLGGFYQLFQVPVEHLSLGLTDPDALLGHHCFAELWERLRPLPSLPQLAQAIGLS